MDLSEEYKKAKEEALTRHLLEMEAMHEPIIGAIRLHIRALACHCECLGMNAENSAAVCAGEIIPFNGERYGKAMEKWGLTDEKGNPTI